jgi:hypothetical protein
MEYLETAGRWLANATIYEVNGLLTVVYFLVNQGTMLISLACAAIVGLIFDTIVQDLAAAAPSRRGHQAPTKTSRHHQILTGICILSWVTIGSMFPLPVPQLGAGMWLLFVATLLLLPSEQASLLWRSKVVILSYCGILLLFRIGATWTKAADPYDWAKVIGSVQEAQQIVGRNRGLILTIASYIAWFGVPVAYVSYVFQRVTTHPMSLRNPFARANDIVHQIRNRPD